MMNKKLKPCPFCGGKAKLQECTRELPFSEEQNSFHVTCTKCGCSPFWFSGVNLHYTKPGMEKAEELKLQAIEAWNRRANNE